MGLLFRTTRTKEYYIYSSPRSRRAVVLGLMALTLYAAAIYRDSQFGIPAALCFLLFFFTALIEVLLLGIRQIKGTGTVQKSSGEFWVKR